MDSINIMNKVEEKKNIKPIIKEHYKNSINNNNNIALKLMTYKSKDKTDHRDKLFSKIV